MEETPGSEMLATILASDLRPDDPASLNRFMSSLPAAEESLVSAWLLQKMPPNAEAVARDWWGACASRPCAGASRQPRAD